MQIILILHNLLRWAVLILGFWAIWSGISGYYGKRSYTVNDNRSNLFFMIICDVQLLIGLVLYFNNGWFARLKDMSHNMKDPYLRFFTIEHLTLMLVAWVLVHIGRASVKRANTDPIKHKRAMLYFGFAMILILSAIPWPFRQAIGRPYFPQFN